MKTLDFLVDRKDLRRCRLAEGAIPDLQPGQALLRVDQFAFTANNVTYAVFGDAMQYWNFFPGPEGWGRVPVWGFADVTRSRHDAVKEGQRFYGYFPMSTHLVVQPDKVTPATFMDGSPHRVPLPAAYQLYQRAQGDAASENAQAILKPLYFTSFLIEDFLSDNALFGATSVVIASASSKTALGVAFLLSRNRPRQCRVIGLTSPRNVTFCTHVGYYDQVATYDAFKSLPADVPTVFVDMAGDGKLLHAVHHHFGDHLRYSCIVGATHWENRSAAGVVVQDTRAPALAPGAAQHGLPGAKPQFFFAPTQFQKRRKEWGQDGAMQRLGQAWDAFMPSVTPWLKVTHGRGPQAVEAVYREVLEGKTRPEQGHIVSLR